MGKGGRLAARRSIGSASMASPSLALRDGKPWLAFGTPGGDQQDQWALQFFLNVVDFGMDLQAAIDAPTVHSGHFPGSFYLHRSNLGRVSIESRVPAATRETLAALGHDVRLAGPWANGQVTAVAYDAPTAVVSAAASPRARAAYAVGR
jgi:gamma-glutamyltranspeptidase/glutathione hydrolase